jgi:hypothetical protein
MGGSYFTWIATGRGQRAAESEISKFIFEILSRRLPSPVYRGINEWHRT